MSQTVHLANTDFEYELAAEHPSSIIERWSLHPTCLQLQFIPLLYAEKEDVIAVTAAPDNAFVSRLESLGWWKEGMPKFVPFDAQGAFAGLRCVPWGSFRSVMEWADGNGMVYDAPQEWEMIRLVNSKAYSHRYTTLPDAVLVTTLSELEDWAARVEGEKVVKSSFGYSGRGNRRFCGVSCPDKVAAFCQAEWLQGRPVICEPWLERIDDFSTQWQIYRTGQIECVGSTRFLTDERGTYQGTLAGPEELLFQTDRQFLEAHKRAALCALKDIAARGYFGYIGIDAMLYRLPANTHPCLCPIVEINARQTMSLAVLRFQKRVFPHSVLKLNFQRHIEPGSIPILPDHIQTLKKTKMNFRMQLTLQVVS